MKISDFCKEYNVRHQTVYKKIHRHKDKLDGHITKNGCMELDDFAVDFLQPAVKREELSERNEKLQSKICEKENEIRELILKQDKCNSKILELEKEVNIKNKEISEKKNVINELTNRISELESKSTKRKGLFEFGKND